MVGYGSEDVSSLVESLRGRMKRLQSKSYDDQQKTRQERIKNDQEDIIKELRNRTSQAQRTGNHEKTVSYNSQNNQFTVTVDRRKSNVDPQTSSSALSRSYSFADRNSTTRKSKSYKKRVSRRVPESYGYSSYKEYESTSTTTSTASTPATIQPTRAITSLGSYTSTMTESPTVSPQKTKSFLVRSKSALSDKDTKKKEDAEKSSTSASISLTPKKSSKSFVSKTIPSSTDSKAISIKSDSTKDSVDIEIERLKKELSKLKKCPECSVETFKRQACIPCGHTFCYDCCEQMKTGFNRKCFKCDQKITMLLHIYLL